MILDAHGITIERLIKQLKAELSATETKASLDKSGDFIYSKPLKDNAIRQRARQDAHKLRGDYPTEKVEVGFRLEDALRALDEGKK